MKEDGDMIFVIGGARSGKSSFAEGKTKELQEKLNTNVLYVATSIPFDDDMKDRVQKHKDSRPNTWHTLEQYKDFKSMVDTEFFKKSDVILLDCMTLMVSNLLLENNVDFDTVPRCEVNVIEANIITEIKNFLSICREYNKNLIIVANEVGLGVVPPYRLGNIFRDIAGRANQLIARECEEVFLLTAGIPLKIK